MGMKHFITAPFDHRAETALFKRLVQFLETADNWAYGESVLIGNYPVEGLTIDALLLTPYHIKAILFKEGGGRMAIGNDGQWTADGSIIEGGFMRKTPVAEMRLALKKLKTTLNLPDNSPAVSGTVLFTRPVDITPNAAQMLPPWLTIGDGTHPESVLEGQMPKPSFSPDFIAAASSLPDLNASAASPTTGNSETAADYFNELTAALRLAPNHAAVYTRFGAIFLRLLNDHTAALHMKFAGPFARVDYLLKEHEAEAGLVRMVNAARVRIRRATALSDKELKENQAYDFKALVKFTALLYGVEVPEKVRLLCPPERAFRSVGTRFDEDVLRMVVEKWDDTFLYGRIDTKNADGIKVNYLFYNTAECDWGYLRDYFHRGMQVNLVRPRFKDGYINAELIILEPDILVDVTAVAGCFTDYGTTPLTYLLNKLRPQPESESITLGAVAGWFLDELVNETPDSRSFRRSLRRFCLAHPLNVLTSGALDDKDAFVADAARQWENIRRAVEEDLPHLVKRYDKKNIILEPTFFSEILGIQGRMDFLQLDKSLVIEQKSGKCGFPQPRPETPSLKLSHYVQVLLYRLIFRYNYRDEYHGNDEIQSFLLYSKYPDSLLAAGGASALEFQAVKVRNQIAWSEGEYAREGVGILDDISAGNFLQNPAKAAFFDKYIRPAIDSVLAPIHRAAPLEKAYFHRFMRFLETEHLLSRTGSPDKPGSGFASAWNESLQNKRSAGNIYDGLLLAPLPQEGHIEEVTLHFNEDAGNDMANFRTGDIVILYPYRQGCEPDATRTIVFRGAIGRMEPDTLTVRLRAPQSNAHVFDYHNYYRWAVEHDFIESSYTALYRAMGAFLNAPEERRRLILMQREPEVDTSRTLKGSYGAFDTLMERVKQAKDIYLIMGPPGTGKTSFGLLNTLREELLEPGTSVMLASYTNRAVDEICSKLTGQGIDFLRIGSRLSCAPPYQPYLLEEKAAECDNLYDLQARLEQTRVFVGTTTALTAHAALFKLKTFSLAIIDEASQILEPHLMGLLCALHGNRPAIRKFVFIGDHKQLPAVVQQPAGESAVTEPLLRRIGLRNCRESFFQRFYERYGGEPRLASMLTRQGRMHPAIALFPNRLFYEDKLREVPMDFQKASLPAQGTSPNGIDNLLATRRLAFIAVRPKGDDDTPDKVNQDEADIIAALAGRIYRKEKEAFTVQTLGVIVPYRNQIVTVRNTICRLHPEVPAELITIDTVERYQGSQRKYIVYGFTVKRPYQLDFLAATSFTDTAGHVVDRKLNVAMTRAQEHLLITGNPALLHRNPTYAGLMDFIHRENGWVDVDKQNFLEGRFKL